MNEQIIPIREIQEVTVKSTGKRIYTRLYSDGHYREVNEAGYGNINNMIFCFKCKEFHKNIPTICGNLIVCV